MSKKIPHAPLAVSGWIVLCAFLNCAGWVLSAVHQLNMGGYIVLLLAGAAAVFVWRKNILAAGSNAFNPAKLAHRFQRPFPIAFLCLATLAFLGGALHAPNNYDALAYRQPRILNWLAEGQWHWVHTEFQRLNTRTTAFEWLCAPLFLFTKSDRLVFLINTVSFFLLPGLMFSLLTRLGVRKRAMWPWMWLLPSAYCYLLEAGSIGNDLFGAVYGLAAVDFALRARASGRLSEACLSVLAAALMTTAKATNLCLLLPWMIAFLGAWRAWLPRPIAIVAIALPAIGASFLPTAALNYHYCRDWTGQAAENTRIGSGPMGLFFFNNAVNYTIENLVPPVFPLASTWNRAVEKHMPESLRLQLEHYFEPAPAHWKLDELQMEESAGLGFGLSLLLIASVMAAWRVRKKAGASPPVDLFIKLLRISPWGSLLYMMVKLEISGAVRYLGPYYPFLMAGLLAGAAQEQIVRRRWWQWWAWISLGLAAMLVIISPARPLWPAQWFFRHFESRLQSSNAGVRAMTVYRVYGNRADAFEPMVKLFPPDATLVGVITSDDPESSLWKPFGSRRIVHVLTKEPAADVRVRGIKYVLVNTSRLQEPWEAWLQRMDARLLQTVQLHLRASDPPSEWRLVELNSHAVPP